VTLNGEDPKIVRLFQKGDLGLLPVKIEDSVYTSHS